VPADSVLGLQLETSLSSDRARVEDRVDAKVTRDVRVGSRVAIPAGARVIGSVVQVGRGGKVRERAFLSVKFHTIVLPDSTELAISTDAVSREGESPAAKSAAKIGGAAVGGAILGAIFGGSRGAAIGGGLGAAGGTTAVMAGDRAAVMVPSGTLLTVRMLSPVTVTVEK
jgi:type IV secretory pathway VirB10-like protein